MAAPRSLTEMIGADRARIAARFESYVEKGDGCWLWRGGTFDDGYPCFTLPRTERGRRGPSVRASHVAFFLAGGVLQVGEYVLHTCDTPLCVRDDHLWGGTQAANMADMVAKGRSLRGDMHPGRKNPENMPRGDAHWSRQRPEQRTRGERHGRAKLTWEKVREMRKLHAEGQSNKVLAARYGVSADNIRLVCLHRTWCEEATSGR